VCYTASMRPGKTRTTSFSLDDATLRNLKALAERRHIDSEGIQAVVKVFPESLFHNRDFEIDVGCCEDADIHLGRVARAGSVHVDPYRAIERYSHVMHIVSGVHGELAPGSDAFDLFAAAFPAGTLVGAPKVRAMQIIDELEPVSRGLYGGTVGYFGARGDMDHAITIRTLVFKGDEYSYQAGAGIVADSVPESEHEEVLAKSAAMARALELAGGTGL